MSTNPERIERARAALKQYVLAKGEVFEDNSAEAADLIADLLHYTAATDQGDDAIESTLRLARMHFDAEHGNPEEEATPAPLLSDFAAYDRYFDAAEKANKIPMPYAVWVRNGKPDSPRGA